jgi:L-alanine-DL-glutamate epimerase-like enolase superfamily enzyme
VLNDITVDNEGYVHAPTKPGLGYEVDWDLVKRVTKAVL